MAAVTVAPAGAWPQQPSPSTSPPPGYPAAPPGYPVPPPGMAFGAFQPPPFANPPGLPPMPPAQQAFYAQQYAQFMAAQMAHYQQTMQQMMLQQPPPQPSLMKPHPESPPDTPPLSPREAFPMMLKRASSAPTFVQRQQERATPPQPQPQPPQRRPALYQPAVGGNAHDPLDPFAAAAEEIEAAMPPPPGFGPRSRRRACTSPAAVGTPTSAAPSRRRVSSLQNLADEADALGLPDSQPRRRWGRGRASSGDPRPGGRVRTHSLTIQIPMASVGSIMGPSGSIMKRLRAESGALIVLQQKEQMLPGQRRRGVTISGTEQEVATAKDMVAACIAADAVADRRGSGTGAAGLELPPTPTGGAPPGFGSTCGGGGRPLLTRSQSMPPRARLSLKPRGSAEQEAGVQMAKGPDGTLGFHVGRSRSFSRQQSRLDGMLPPVAESNEAPASPASPKLKELRRTWSCGALDWSYSAQARKALATTTAE